MNINITLFYQMIFFIIFVWFTLKYVWNPILDAINDRKKSIADGLAAAEKGVQAEEDARKEVERLIVDAKVQAGEILNRAEKRGNEIVDEARDSAKHEGDRIKKSAHAEIEAEVNKAKETLRGQVSELAVTGAKQILKREIDSNSHKDLLESLAAKL